MDCLGIEYDSMNTPKQDIRPNQSFGVIGLGAMGYGAASSLLRAGFEVWGCDVRNATLAAFQKLGGRGVAQAQPVTVWAMMRL